jgi:hypothetical protein
MQPEQGSTMSKTILIVDDNAYNRRELCKLFKREEDFEICGEAANGKEAIAKRRVGKSPWLPPSSDVLHSQCLCWSERAHMRFSRVKSWPRDVGQRGTVPEGQSVVRD